MSPLPSFDHLSFLSSVLVVTFLVLGSKYLAEAK